MTQQETELEIDNQIASDIFVGKMLQEARKKKKLTIQEVRDLLNISDDYIVALEKGEHHMLPGPTYVNGFLRSYAALLNIDTQQLVEHMVKEPVETQQQGIMVPTFLSPSERPSLIIVIAAVALLALSYGVWVQFIEYDVLTPPSLTDYTDGETIKP